MPAFPGTWCSPCSAHFQLGLRLAGPRVPLGLRALFRASLGREFLESSECIQLAPTLFFKESCLLSSGRELRGTASVPPMFLEIEAEQQGHQDLLFLGCAADLLFKDYYYDQKVTLSSTTVSGLVRFLDRLSSMPTPRTTKLAKTRPSAVRQVCRDSLQAACYALVWVKAAPHAEAVLL